MVPPDIHPSLLCRKIIHFDMDAFYAAIEARDDPSLQGKPIVVGGSPQSRGVVCTASYEARRYGIRSAMACAHAARLCPHAIFLRPSFEKYRSVSQAIREIFQRYTSLVEPLSLDEAYLDVTDNQQGLYAVRIAKLIQEEIWDSLKLTGSAGVAPNKLVAKIASDIHKPHGLTVILPEQVQVFMGSLPLRKIHGIGPATEGRLASYGLRQCSDVWSRTIDELTEQVGNMADWLWHRARGIDERPVQTSRLRKSLGHEETFHEDLLDRLSVETELQKIAESVSLSLAKRSLRGRTITLKIKYADFTQITRRHSLWQAVDDSSTINDVAKSLLDATEAGQRKIRLVGVVMSNLEELSQAL